MGVRVVVSATPTTNKPYDRASVLFSVQYLYRAYHATSKLVRGAYLYPSGFAIYVLVFGSPRGPIKCYGPVQV